MTPARPGAALALLLLLGLCRVHSAQGQPATPQLQTVLDRIHTLAANDDWRKEGVRDEQIEAWLDRLVLSIAKAVDFPELKPPVRLADVRPVDLAPGRRISRALVIGKNIKSGVALSHSVVLADGHVELGGVEGCVIIARGGVRLLSSRYSVIVSGVLVDISGNDGQGDAANGSIIVSRRQAALKQAYGSLIWAPEGLSLDRIQSRYVTHLGAAERDFGDSKTVQVPDLPVELLPPHPLSQAVKIEGIVRADSTWVPPPLDPRLMIRDRSAAGHVGVVFRHRDRRYVAERARPIVDQAGQPVEALSGWQLTMITEAMAIFSNDTTDVAVRLPGSP